MSRPYSWYPLASSDPVPGDPAVVRAGGEHYRHVAEAIGEAERVLRTLVDAQDAVSHAVDAIRDRTHAVADRIRRAQQRYLAAGDAPRLRPWHRYLVGRSADSGHASHRGIETATTRAAGDAEAFARGGGRIDQLVTAAQDLQAARGWDRVLTLGGHGSILRQNSVLRAQQWEAFPFRPGAFLTLLGPAAKGTLLEGLSTVQYLGDATLNLTSAARTVADIVAEPVPDPAVRLEL